VLKAKPQVLPQHGPKHTPSPEEIKRETAKIRASWNSADFFKRSGKRAGMPIPLEVLVWDRHPQGRRTVKPAMD